MKNSWINVNERFPKLVDITEDSSISFPVLINVRRIGVNTVDVASYIVDYKGPHWRTDKHLYMLHEVTHWQPIELPD